MKIRRVCAQEVPEVHALTIDVLSRLPSEALYAMVTEDDLYAHVQDHGEIHGAFLNGRLVAYTILAFPGLGPNNLGREFGVPQAELQRVASLDGTVVHESVRGQGLQRQFHELREQRALAKGCLYLFSTVHPENHVSRLNLEAAGFELKFSRPMYGGLPRHCYAKRLG
ncbi:GNAT family N-acetyltransferase [Paenibacillus sp. SYP-B3998]|uniref:GNAT family N-acetyltransferase n=1 Tax=Paenibacillus sp. SYP-B3998 TaxID=2678564 RepID=UPI001F075085|nr:GNAT family N-acetyltransferase [Paenibacillus sp. SYP-B3998]